MKIIIDIDDNLYTRLFDDEDINAMDMFKSCVAIRKGTPLSKGHGDLIIRNDVINMFNTMDRYRADKLILQDTDREFPSNEVFIVDDCYELLEQLPTYSAEQTADNNSVLDNIRAEIDALPRIKVGNSNSPTVKYCIDERLLYEIFEEMKGDTK